MLSHLYEIKVTAAEVERYVLHEGAAMKLFAPAELFDLRLTPYDSFALWLHFARAVLRTRNPHGMIL